MTKSKIWTKKKVYNVFIFLILPYANHSKIRSELHAGKSTKVWQSVIVSHSLNPCSMRRVYITVVNIFESCCDHRTPGKLACQFFFCLFAVRLPNTRAKRCASVAATRRPFFPRAAPNSRRSLHRCWKYCRARGSRVTRSVIKAENRIIKGQKMSLCHCGPFPI